MRHCNILCYAHQYITNHMYKNLSIILKCKMRRYKLTLLLIISHSVCSSGQSLHALPITALHSSSQPHTTTLLFVPFAFIYVPLCPTSAQSYDRLDHWYLRTAFEQIQISAVACRRRLTFDFLRTVRAQCQSKFKWQFGAPAFCAHRETGLTWRAAGVVHMRRAAVINGSREKYSSLLVVGFLYATAEFRRARSSVCSLHLRLFYE